MKLSKIIAISGLVLAASTAQASLILTVDDSATSGIDITVNDDGTAGFDIVNNNGIVAYNTNFLGGLTNWELVASSSANQADVNPLVHFDANVKSKNSTAVNSTLTIVMTDDSFTLNTNPVNIFFMDIGGSGELAFDYKVELFDDVISTDLAIFSWSGAGSFADTMTATVGELIGEYTLKVTAEFTANGSTQQSSFDSTVKVPEPATLALFGLGLLGMGAARRRRA